LLKKKKIKNQ